METKVLAGGNDPESHNQPPPLHTPYVVLISAIASSTSSSLNRSVYKMFLSLKFQSTPRPPTYSRAATYSPAKVEVVTRLPNT